MRIAALFLLCLWAISANAQTVIIDDSFDDAVGLPPNVGTNQNGIGNGFLFLGQPANGTSSESGGNAIMTSSGSATSVLQSVDTYDPFLPGRQTVHSWELGPVGASSLEFSRQWVGFRTSTLKDAGNPISDHFLPHQEGMYISLYNTSADINYGQTSTAFLIADVGGTRSILAEWAWSAFPGSGTTLTLVTTETHYELRSTGVAMILQAGNFSGALPGTPVGSSFAVGGHHQRVSLSTLEWERVRVTQQACPGTGIIYVDDSASGTGYGDTWTNAMNHLRDAIDLSQSCGTITEIRVAGGTYKPDEGLSATDNDTSSTFELLDGVIIRGGYRAMADGDTFRDVSTYPSVLSGDLDGSGTATSFDAFHVVRCSATPCASSASLIGFTVERGNAVGAGADANGGGLYLEGTGTTLEQLVVQHNAANDGAGIYAAAGTHFLRDIRLTQNAASQNGGGIAAVNLSLVYAPRVDMVSNTAGRAGGGGYANNASLIVGGALIESNIAVDGGGVAAEAGGHVQVMSSILRANQGSDGGAGYSLPGGFLRVRNSTVTENQATDTSPQGSAFVSNGATLTATNNIIYANAPTSSQIFTLGGGTSSLDYNIVSGIDGTATNNNAIVTDPLFVGGGDYSLQPASPGIDAGSQALLPNDFSDLDGDGARGTELLPIGFAGNARVIESEVDLGAHESDFDYDFGDLPDPFAATAGQYPTLVANNGARHYLPVTPTVYLSGVPGVDADGQPSPNADADGVEESGAAFPASITMGAGAGTNHVTITTVGSGKINAWIDWNGDGVFAAGEQILTDVNSAGGVASHAFGVPAGTPPGSVGARVRYSTAGGDGPTGRAADGEVEDYIVSVVADTSPVVTLPDPATTPNVSGPFTIDVVGGTLAVVENGGTTLFSTSSTGQVTVNGTASNDEFVIDLDTGNPIPAGGLVINAGGGNDLLTIVSTVMLGTVVDASSGPGAGRLTIDGSIVDYNEFEPVVMPAAASFTKDGTIGDDDITIAVVGPNLKISEAAMGFESLEFPSTTTLTVNSLGGNDTITLDPNVTSAVVSVLNLNGDGGDDTFIVPPTDFDLNIAGGTHSNRDILDLDLTGVTGQDISSVPPADGNWTFTSAGDNQIDFTGIERHLDAIDLSVALSNTPSGLPFPTYVDVTVTITNNSDYAALMPLATFNMPAPAGLAFNSVQSGNATWVGGVLTLTPGLAASGSVDVVVRFDCTAIDDVTVTATLATSDPIDFDPANDAGNTLVGKPDLDFGDAPAAYPVAFADDGARHYRGQAGTTDIRLGATVDTAEADGVNSLNADADGADEDGVIFPSTLLVGSVDTRSSFVVSVTGSGRLSAWIDFDNDDAWANDAVERVVNDMALTGGTTTVHTFTVPLAAAGGNTVAARFRYCTNAGECNTPTGASANGEVEDYVVDLIAAPAAVTIDVPPNVLTGELTWSVVAGEVVLQDAAANILFESALAEMTSATVNGTTGDDVLNLNYGAADQIIPTGGFTFNGGDGADELEVDLADFALDGRTITFNGGNPTTGSGDFLIVENSAGGTSYDFLSIHTDEDTGTFHVDKDSPVIPGDYNDLNILYDGLEPIIYTATPTKATFQFNDDDNTINLNGSGDVGGLGNGFSFIDCVTCGEDVTFTTPTDSLIVRPGGGDDTITFPNLDVAAPVPLNVLIQGESGNDRFIVTPSPFYDPHIMGEDPVLPSCYGDILDIVTEGGITDHSLVYERIGTGKWTFTAASNLDVTFDSIESQLDARTEISVEVTASGNEFYPTDPITLTYSVTNNGIEHATCVIPKITIPDAVNPTEPIVPSRGIYYDGSPPTLSLPTLDAPEKWVIPWLQAGVTATMEVTGIMDAHIQDVYYALLKGIVPPDSTENAGLVISVDSLATNNADSVLVSLLPTFPFPAKGEGIAALQVNLPNGLERVLVGLSQGSPGLNTGVLCRIPDPDGVLFTQVGVGNRWRPCGEGLPHPIYVTDLFLDSRGTPADSTDDWVWAATWGSEGLYYSTDFGETFASAAAVFPGETPGWTTVYAIEEDASGIIYLSANTGTVYRSFDRGASWQKVTSLPGASADLPWSLTAHPTEAGVLYAGVFGRGVYHTDDYGFTWQPLGSAAVNDLLISATGGHIFDLEFSPDSNEYLFAGTGRGVHRIRLNAGGSVAGLWDELDVRVTLDDGTVVIPEIRTLAFDPDADDVDDDLLAGSWGFGAFEHTAPISVPTLDFVEFALKEGYVSVLLPLQNGDILVGNRGGGVQTVASSDGVTSTTNESIREVPTAFALAQNFPNPFNPSTTIGFDVPTSGRVHLAVYDVLGREVAVLVSGVVEAGHHKAVFDASGMTSGTYLYRLQTGGGAFTRQFVLMK